MINGIMKPHVNVYTREALLINDDTGPKCTLLSSVRFEQMGYTWVSFHAIKKHHDARFNKERNRKTILTLQNNVTLFAGTIKKLADGNHIIGLELLRRAHADFVCNVCRESNWDEH
jgi:hypothetical protein